MRTTYSPLMLILGLSSLEIDIMKLGSASWKNLTSWISSLLKMSDISPYRDWGSSFKISYFYLKSAKFNLKLL